MDYKLVAEQKKAQETRVKQAQRAGVIDKPLKDANKQGEKTNVEGTPVRRSRRQNSSLRLRRIPATAMKNATPRPFAWTPKILSDAGGPRMR